MARHLNSFQTYALRVLPEAEPCGNWIVLESGETVMSYDAVDREAEARRRAHGYAAGDQTINDVR